MGADTAQDRAGDTVAGKYRLTRLLGAGGMGAVYVAEHVFTKRQVAVKLMHPGIAKSRLAAERFIRESQAPSAIGHPGIVQVLDGGFDEDGGLYLVLELLDGVTLSDALDEGALDTEAIVRIAGELLDALAAAHEKGFVHRDIKPDNLFLAHDGRGGVTVKLLDFGIASVLSHDENKHLTQTGAVLGTPLYMSPEQAKGQRVDARSDLWSVGALLYRALSGQLPYEGESYNALIVSIVTREHLPFESLRPDLPDALIDAVERALRKDLARRWQSAREMGAALAGVRFGAAPSPPPSPRTTPRVQPAPAPATDDSALRRWALALSAVLVVLLAAAGFLLLRPRPKPQAPSLPAAARVEPPPAETVHAAAPQPEQTAAARQPETPAKQPRAPEPQATGLPEEALSPALAEAQPALQKCLEDSLVAQMIAGQPQASTLRLDVKLRVAPNGSVAAAEIAGDAPAELRECVGGRLRRATFPAATAATDFRFPLVFQPTIIGK